MSFDPHPIVMWELTRACDLHCMYCVFGADDRQRRDDLSTYESYKTIDQIAALAPREFIVTGGDPLQRTDVCEIVDYSRRRGLDPSLVVSATTRLTTDAIDRLVRNGLTRIVFSIDGSVPEIHHAVQGTVNTFGMTLRSMRWAECAGLAIEVNTLVHRRNMGDLKAIVELIRPFHITRWNVHFLVPVGAATNMDVITADECEHVFEMLEDIRPHEDFAIRVVEAPHYRRYRLQRELHERLAHTDENAWADFAGYEGATTDASREWLDAAIGGATGFVYVSHAGDVRASAFLPQSAGNLRYRHLAAIYRSSELFVALRDTDNLKGRCGRCEFRHVCGGSRARSWAVTGDLFGDDPLCAYKPPATVATNITPMRPAPGGAA